VSRQRREEFRPYAKESLLAERDLGGEEGEEDGQDEAAAPEEAEALAADDDFDEAASLDAVEREDLDDDERPEDQY
jgi:hypothetical protein